MRRVFMCVCFVCMCMWVCVCVCVSCVCACECVCVRRLKTFHTTLRRIARHPVVAFRLSSSHSKKPRFSLICWNTPRQSTSIGSRHHHHHHHHHQSRRRRHYGQQHHRCIITITMTSSSQSSSGDFFIKITFVVFVKLRDWGPHSYAGPPRFRQINNLSFSRPSSRSLIYLCMFDQTVLFLRSIQAHPSINSSIHHLIIHPSIHPSIHP